MNGPSESDLAPITGTVHGVRISGSLPAGFEPYLLPPPGPGIEPASSLEATFRPIDTLPELDEIWSSEPDSPRWLGRFGLARAGEGIVLSVETDGRGLFRLGRETIEIEWLRGTPGAAHAFFAYALPLWLETRGVPVLHAGAVASEGRAVAFLAHSGVGKSTLIAELVRLGRDFVAEDGLALRKDAGGWRCFCGPPLIRLWPSALEGRLGLVAEELPRVSATVEKRSWRVPEPGPPRPEGLELTAIYRLDRRPGPAGPVKVLPCSPRESLALLLEHGLAASPAAALGFEAERLELLARVAESVPIRRLSMPSAPDSGRRVLEAVHGDLSS